MAFLLRRFAQTTTATLQRQVAQRKPPVQSICPRHERLFASTNEEGVQLNLESSKNPDVQLALSDSCKKRLQQICKDGSFLRITVEGGGCSGFQYKFDLDTKLSDQDLTFGDDHAKVVIDSISLEYCGGATVDYHEELIRAGFRMIANPKAEQGCSCGASFSIKID